MKTISRRIKYLYLELLSSEFGKRFTTTSLAYMQINFITYCKRTFNIFIHFQDSNRRFNINLFLEKIIFNLLKMTPFFVKTKTKLSFMILSLVKLPFHCNLHTLLDFYIKVDEKLRI
jgi:hypothetical protein